MAGEQAQALLQRFEQANDELIETVERCSEAQWRKTTAAENWAVGLTAHHVAESIGRSVERIDAIANGRSFSFPPGQETSDARNALHAERYANCTKEETLALLRDTRASAVKMLSALSDEQIERNDASGQQPRSVREWVDILLINHPRNHLQSIRATL
jgi:uncharacterized damage-inducible protein DinB